MAYRKKEDWDKVASTLVARGQLAPKFANYWFERGYALEMQAQKKTRLMGRGEGAVPEVHRERSQLRGLLLGARPTCSCGPTTSRRRSRTTPRRSSTIRRASRYYNALADLYIRLGYIKEAEQVLKEAKAFAKPQGDKIAVRRARAAGAGLPGRRTR